MESKKPRIVIIGGGMAGLTAAHKLHSSAPHLFDLHLVEGGTRLGGRINSAEFCGDGVELGATWIHGIQGNPIHNIAQHSNLLNSPRPSEFMDGFPKASITAAEGGHNLNPALVSPISNLFNNLIDFMQGKDCELAPNSHIIQHCINQPNLSVGSFLRSGLDAYWSAAAAEDKPSEIGKWQRKPLEEAVFAMHENRQRIYMAADDLCDADYAAERHPVTFPGEEITIARGYSAVIDSLASALPPGVIQLERRVEKIEWRLGGSRPVRLHFGDGSTLSADHVIVTVSLGVLKRGIGEDRGMFNPPLPTPKIRAISRLGFGVVDKVFLQQQNSDCELPSLLQMVFHQPDSGLRNTKIPDWIRRSPFIYPIYKDSTVSVSWFAGKDALEVEELSEKEIVNGVSAAASDFLCLDLKFGKVLRSRWGSDPLFLGSYSYVALGSSSGDMDALAEPLPEEEDSGGGGSQLQVMFAGEATHAVNYSTTHGAYLSGIREANRLLQQYGVAAAVAPL